MKHAPIHHAIPAHWHAECEPEAPTFHVIESYWRDPSAMDAETQRNRDTANAAIDEGIRRARERRAARKGENL